MSIRQGGILIAGGSQSTVEALNVDEYTITHNKKREIEVIGKVNQNEGGSAETYIYDWIGTLAEYEAQDVANKHADWICFITDDNVAGGSGGTSLPEMNEQTAGKYLTNENGEAKWGNEKLLVNRGGTGSVAVGTNVSGTYEGSVVIGDSAKTDGANGTSIGYGASTNMNGTALGYQSKSDSMNSTAVGSNSQALSENSCAIGSQANVSDNASYAIQIGIGTNSEASSLYVGLSSSSNYKLLDSNGNIPDDRIPQLGDIATLLDTFNGEEF